MNIRTSISLVTIALAGCSQLQMNPVTPATNTGSVQAPVTQTQNSIPETISGAVTIGSDDARVTMLLFTNPDCAYCKEFDNDLMTKLHEEFIDVGVLKVEVISLPLKKYPNSERNAKMMICGAMSGSGANVYDQLFDGKTTSPSLRTCLEDKNGAVEKNYMTQQDVIRSLDVTLIPTYFLNGKKYTGLPDYADLRGQINEALKR